MSTPSRYQQWTQPLLAGRVGIPDTVEPDPDPDDPTDYANVDEGGAVQVGIDVGSVAKVQDDLTHAGAGTITGTFGATPEQGNTLIACLAVRGWTTTASMLSSGWTLHSETPRRTGASDGGRIYFWYKTAGASESTSVAINATDVKDLYIAEWSGLGSPDSADGDNPSAPTTNMTAGPITPTSSDGVIFAGFVQASRNGVLALGGGYTEDMDVDVDASGPSAVFGHLIVDPFTGSYSVTATSDQSDTYGWFLISFAAAGGGVSWFPGPAANDDDSATSAFSDSADECLRVALDVARAIYKVELEIGQETAGTTVYELHGTDDPTFASTTLLATLTFTATGSFTSDTVSATWVPDSTYTYFQLVHVSGGGSEREFYEIRLFSTTSLVPITEHGDLSGRDDPAQHPADAITLLDAAGWFTATDVEAGIAELAAKSIGVFPHGNMGATETFDAAIGWHSGTLDANCTLTLTAAPTGTASSLFLELTQDSGGGNTITLPASVFNKADLEADQDTTGDSTSFLVLLSRDGGTNWYGGWWGQGGGSDLTIEDEGTPLATAATTLDFVGAGVTASGATGDKTITISGAPTGAAGGDLSGTYPNPSVVNDSHAHTSATVTMPTGLVGPILITDTPAGSPLIFGDLLQTEDGDDLLYADV